MWLKGTIVGLSAVGTLTRIWAIDKPRKPVTKLDALVGLVLDAALIVGILHYWR